MMLIPDRLVTICPFSMAGHQPKGCIGNKCMWFITVTRQDDGKVVQGGCAVPMMSPLLADIQTRFSSMTVEVKRHGA